MVAFSSILPNQLGHTLVTEGLRLSFVKVVGKGAYGIVYLAWDLSTPQHAPRYYAVKCTLKYERNTEYEVLQQREILYHSAMSGHSNVTTLHRVIEQEHYVYFILDYHEGGDLFGAIMDRRTFHRNDAAVKMAFVQLLDAVQACHDAGISHRDLKPENVMCSQQDSRISLTDFGLATQSGLSNSYGCGSSHYMSPECVGSLEGSIPYSTRRSDIWSLGIILINMLTGRNPWQIASIARDEGFSQYVRGRTDFLSAVLDISHEAAGMLSRILDPSPRSRITLSELRIVVLNMRTFFPGDNVPDRVGAMDGAFPASAHHHVDAGAGTGEPSAWNEDQIDDDELIIDVPFDMIIPQTSSMSVFSSVPLDTPQSHSSGSTFVNQLSSSSSSSSMETDETAPPSTPVSPATEIPAFIPTLALVAGEIHKEEVGRGELVEDSDKYTKFPTHLRRFMGVMRRVALRA